MRKPNFFIIGAPKCGTTSLATWLNEHPNIYMSPKKEPHYFSPDINSRRYRSLEYYESLFKEATSEHLATGEASVHYLYSKVAIPNILEYCSDPKFIVMLRNPVAMAYSLYEQRVFNMEENIKDFEAAWNMQKLRSSNKEIPPLCDDPQYLLYGDICKLGEQIERLFKLVPKERVLTIVLDDLKKDPRHEYLKSLQFLSVPDDSRSDFMVHNGAKERRSVTLRKMVKVIGRVQHKMKIPPIGTGIIERIDKANKKQRQRKPMSDEMSKRLKVYFKDDVEKLGQLINRDLKNWVR